MLLPISLCSMAIDELLLLGPNRYRGRQLQFPVADDFFPVVTLSLAQVQEYEAQVQELAAKALQACLEHEAHAAGFGEDQDKRWHEVAREADLTTSRRKQRTLCATRTSGRVTGDFRRFVDFFSAETSAQLFAWNQFFYGCAVDAAVLCSLNLRVPQQQASLGIKWRCLQPSRLTRKRDECFLEYVAFQKDSQRRDVAVIVHLPIEIPECPPLPREMKTKREKTTTATVVRAADSHPGATQLFMLSQCDSRGLAASSKYCRKLLRALKDVSLCADAKHIAAAISSSALLDQTSRLGETQGLGETMRPWVPKRIRAECTICARSFRAGHRRHHCHLCGDVFCSKCLVRRAAIRQKTSDSNAATNQRTFRVVQTRFCKMCVTRSREEDEESLMQQHLAATQNSRDSSRSSTLPRQSQTSSRSSTLPRYSQCSSRSSSLARHSQPRQIDGPRRSTTWTDETRASWWSEAESDTDSWKSASCRFSTASRNFSAAPTVRSSVGSEYSLPGRSSFVAVQALETATEFVPERIEEELGKRSSIVEVIDTKDMVPESELQRQLRSQQPPTASATAELGFGELRDTVRTRYMSTPVAPSPVLSHSNCRRTRSTDQGQAPHSTRSLDQCLAEQHELLRQVLSASRGLRPEGAGQVDANAAVTSCLYHRDVGHDDGVYEL
ncbi:hypothetical protein BBJ28_00018355 [Nothophytophthora sp. Chile5]|nr:hypothetical protein BBJ28_00018355 [Nothophytophthora sp. Chile5]